MRTQTLLQTKKIPHPIDVEVGKRIMLRRKVIGMSQSTLAQGLGISFQQVQKYERGTNRVGSSRLNQIAQVLCVPISSFFPEADLVVDVRAAKDREPKDPVMAFLETAECRTLNIAFANIKSKAVRRKILNLVTTLAGPDVET